MGSRPSQFHRQVDVRQIQYGDQEKLDILNKLDEDPSYQGPGTDQVETWTELNLRGLGCRLPNSILRLTNLKTFNVSNNIFITEELIVTIFNLEALEDLDMSNCSITFIPPEISMPRHLRKLNLSGNQLTVLPLPVCNLVTLEELDLKNNNITTITPDVERLCKLTKIDISRNPLKEFPITILKMKALESLNLERVNITTIPLQLKQLTNLSELYLSNNRLKEFPLSLFDLKKLETLDLPNTNITTVPWQITQLENLKKLNLSGNHLKRIPMTVCELVTLETLNLAKNNITSVPPQITQLTNLKGLYLDWNLLKKFPMSVCELVTLETLDLMNNNIIKVTRQITQLKNLKKLNLSMNNLKNIPMSLCELVTLETLKLWDNNITAVPPQITQLKNLKGLYLGRNQLKEFPMSVCELVTLETLDLSETNITTVPPQITQIKNLKELNLFRNQLKGFLMSVCKLVTLETVDLAETNITTVPPQITQLKNIKELKLHLNPLKKFPMPVCKLVNLETLGLSGTEIITVPPQIVQLKNLKELYLSGNQLKEFPMSVCNLVTLETLDLSATNISTVPPKIKKLKNLKHLGLYGNQLKEFPMSVCKLVSLEILDLQKNRVSTVPPQIAQLKNLKEFNLSGNQLKAFPMSLCELVTLETIYLGCNRISQLPPQIKKLQKLKIIQLDENKLVQLPSAVRQLSHLIIFSVNGNNLEQPPQEVADKGINAIKRYFNDLVQTNAASSFRLQIQVIGETCSGKTSLVKTLTSGTPFLTTMADRTHVMEQILWSPKEDVFFSINDFGGHDVYKVAHNFFITKEAVTLIVFNLQNVSLNFQVAVGSWIDNVYSRAPDSAMLLVGTHADCLSSEEVERSSREVSSALSSHLDNMASRFKTRLEELEKRSYGKVSGQEARNKKMLRIKRLMGTPPHVGERVFVISSENGHGIAELEEMLIRKAREKNYILPESWLQKVEHIETAKRKKQDTFLTVESLTNIVELTPSQIQGDDDAQRIEDVLSFLHATGAVLWFRDKPFLKNFIFHRQDVFIDILKAVLRHDIDSILVYDTDPFNKKFTKEKFESAKRDVIRRGIISRTMLECLWRRFNFGKQGLGAMLELLEYFEVCYVVREADGDSYHFPWLLKEDRPEYIHSSWPIVPARDESQISTQIHFPVACPTGLYEMVAVHLHGYLREFKASRRDWKDGFYAQLDNQFRICLEREVIGSPPNGVIRLSIRGNDPIQLKRYSLRIFRDLLSLTEKECPGSPRDEFLVCPHCVHEENNPPTLFDTPITLLSVPLEAPVPYHPCPEENPKFMASADFYYPVTVGEMTVLHCMSLEKHAPLILKNIRRFGCLLYILSRLQRAGIFTKTEITAIKEPDQGNRLQSFLKGKSDFAFYQFCGALHDTGHAQTARLLRLPDLAMELPEDVLCTKILQRLMKKGVITLHDMIDVWRKPLKIIKVLTLLGKLRKGKCDYEADRALNEFRDAIYDERSKQK